MLLACLLYFDKFRLIRVFEFELRSVRNSTRVKIFFSPVKTKKKNRRPLKDQSFQTNVIDQSSRPFVWIQAVNLFLPMHSRNWTCLSSLMACLVLEEIAGCTTKK